MSAQEVTYTSVRFHKSSVSENQVRPRDTQGPREAGCRGSSVPQLRIVIALGLLCSLLLVTVAVLVANIFQYHHEKHELLETLNHYYNCCTVQCDIDIKEELLRNKSIDCGPGNDLLESLNKAQNRWHSETKSVSGYSQHTGKSVKTHWFCYGIKCYHFIMDTKTWAECQDSCQHSSLSLLTIDDEDELKFLQPQVTPDNYWIGLSYDKKKEEWSWINKVPSKLDLNIKKFKLNDGNCVFLSKTRLENTNCGNSYSCICGKRLDKFPD
ncbi:killer cell lectin-like receptor 5 [Arvicanthis niloticus]|uniref:killer cell lectin-like receptor 5 n=1 Tax=Arvicanthis niloticus TaxID=61156 RepID=UPI001485EE42|nr:killer cell lectin-like receptor 5 isoform X1 [Arvicanthis niloticus]